MALEATEFGCTVSQDTQSVVTLLDYRGRQQNFRLLVIDFSSSLLVLYRRYRLGLLGTTKSFEVGGYHTWL